MELQKPQLQRPDSDLQPEREYQSSSSFSQQSSAAVFIYKIQNTMNRTKRFLTFLRTWEICFSSFCVSSYVYVPRFNSPDLCFSFSSFFELHHSSYQTSFYIPLFNVPSKHTCTRTYPFIHSFISFIAMFLISLFRCLMLFSGCIVYTQIQIQ